MAWEVNLDITDEIHKRMAKYQADTLNVLHDIVLTGILLLTMTISLL